MRVILSWIGFQVSDQRAFLESDGGTTAPYALWLFRIEASA
jgi:hypothetical protein